MNRGARSLDSTKASAGYRVRTALAHYLYGFSCALAVVLIGVYSGLVPLLHDAGLFLGNHTQTIGESPVATQAGPRVVFGMEPSERSQRDVTQKPASTDNRNSVSHHRGGSAPTMMTTKAFIENL